METDRLQVWADRFIEKSKRFLEPKKRKSLRKKRKPKIIINPKLKTTAGQFYSQVNRIEINPSASPRHQKETLGHELAHWYAYIFDNSHGHGSEFKKYCKAFGVSGSEYNHYPELLIKGKGRLWECGECRLKVRTTKDLGTYNFSCVKCGSPYFLLCSPTV